MYTLGINAVFHDSAACLVRDGTVVAAAEEERFTRIKHGKRPLPFSTWELPFNAAAFCLRQAGITMREVAQVAYSFSPSILLDRIGGLEKLELPVNPLSSVRHYTHPLYSEWDPLFLTQVLDAPAQLRDGAPHHLKEYFAQTSSGPAFRYVPHHLAHAASAFLCSPFMESAVLCLDGRGELSTTSYWHGEGSGLNQRGNVEMPNSLGLLYEEFTDYLGFLRSSDEYKVMALASFGQPAFIDELRDLVSVEPGGKYVVRDLKLTERFGPARQRHSEFTSRHFDLARSLQVLLEEKVIEICRWLHAETGSKNLCMAGGVALNCVMNARVRDSGIFENVWVQPAAGDAGTALGAALAADVQRSPDGARNYRMDDAYLGPAWSDEEIEKFLQWSKVPYRRMNDVATECAEVLSRDMILGWFQGRMEFGPRALGARSILASPLNADMQQRLNDIKDREDFRPVAPVVIEERASEWFSNCGVSPFMLFVFDVPPERATRIPAVSHVDRTARVQTVRREQNPLYYDLLLRFEERTGVPVLVNTSFNTRSEPIVCSPRDAIECFWSSPLDALAIGSFLLRKRES